MKETLVKDIDGNSYKTVKIGEQIWMAENLKVTQYRNGDPIPNLTDENDWENTEQGAYCNYDNNEDNVETYGRLYNWYAVDDKRGLAPRGWHISTDDEIKELEMYLGLSQSEAGEDGPRGTNEGSKLANRKDLWDDGILQNNPEFGTSGFDFLPGGYRYYGNGNYSHMGSLGYFWSSTEYGSNYAWYRELYYNTSEVGRYGGSKKDGFSVRCVKDSISLSIKPEVIIPEGFALHQNFPNPFNPNTSLRYDLLEQAQVTLTVYDMLGRVVTQLINTTQEAGYRSVQWNATDIHGKPVSAGVYLYQIRAGEFVQTRKMVLLK